MSSYYQQSADFAAFLQSFPIPLPIIDVFGVRLSGIQNTDSTFLVDYPVRVVVSNYGLSQNRGPRKVDWNVTGD